MGTVLFEKKYKKDIPTDLNTGSKKSNQPAAADNGFPDSFEEYMKEVYKNRFSIPIPQRMKQAPAFISLAREISELYHLDVKITEYVDHISVNYYFDSSGAMGFLRHVVRYADDIAFFSNIKGYDIVMCLDYYTHAVFHKGRRLYP